MEIFHISFSCHLIFIKIMDFQGRNYVVSRWKICINISALPTRNEG